MLYKAVNTLDSMVGYHNEKYENLGKFSAKMDDIFNFIFFGKRSSVAADIPRDSLSAFLDRLLHGAVNMLPGFRQAFSCKNQPTKDGICGKSKGRLCCALASEADAVIRVWAGVPQVIKGEMKNDIG